MDLTADQKFEMLRTAYEERRKEVNFWRERSWKVVSWLVGVFLAFSVGATTVTIEKFPYLLIPLFALSVLATMYLHKNYKVYCERWQRLADIEDALGFFEVDMYVTGKSLNPSELRKPMVTYKGTAFFILAIWAVFGSPAVVVLLK